MAIARTSRLLIRGRLTTAILMVNKDIVRTVFLKPIAAFAVGGKKMPRPLSQLVRRPLCWISCFSSIFVIYSQRLLTPTVIGNWIQAEPTGCATKCGVAAGSGTPGAVTCDSSSCDAKTKPKAKQCPKTMDCGTLFNQHTHTRF